MSDATVRYPADQSASQLSENIGDVLASIRRLIAQDEAAEVVEARASLQEAPAARAIAAAAAPLRDDILRPTGVLALEPVARRRDILAEAQALTRRSEAAFGRAQSPLALDARDRVNGFHAALPGRMEPVPGAAAPLVLTAPLRPTEATAVARPPEAPPAAATLVVVAANETRSADKAQDMTTPTPQPVYPSTAPAPREEMFARSEGNLDGQPPASPALQTVGPAIVPPPGPATVAPRPADAAPAAPQEPAPAAASVCQAPAATPACTDEDEDCTASILREMIRDVVRQELQGDPSGRMPGDLRSMIMREVAQVLTQGARAPR